MSLAPDEIGEYDLTDGDDPVWAALPDEGFDPELDNILSLSRNGTFGPVRLLTWDESKHPRAPEGTSDGGRWVKDSAAPGFAARHEAVSERLGARKAAKVEAVKARTVNPKEGSEDALLIRQHEHFNRKDDDDTSELAQKALESWKKRNPTALDKEQREYYRAVLNGIKENDLIDESSEAGAAAARDMIDEFGLDHSDKVGLKEQAILAAQSWEEFHRDPYRIADEDREAFIAEFIREAQLPSHDWRDIVPEDIEVTSGNPFGDGYDIDLDQYPTRVDETWNTEGPDTDTAREQVAKVIGDDFEGDGVPTGTAAPGNEDQELLKEAAQDWENWNGLVRIRGESAELSPEEWGPQTRMLQTQAEHDAKNGPQMRLFRGMHDMDRESVEALATTDTIEIDALSSFTPAPGVAQRFATNPGDIRRQNDTPHDVILYVKNGGGFANADVEVILPKGAKLKVLDRKLWQTSAPGERENADNMTRTYLVITTEQVRE